MVNFEKSIMKAVPKIRKEYLKEWNEEIRGDIYVDVDRIDIMYDDDAWADVTIAWGRDDEEMPFHCRTTVAIYPRHLKYIVGYILGVMQ